MKTTQINEDNPQVCWTGLVRKKKPGRPRLITPFPKYGGVFRRRCPGGAIPMAAHEERPVRGARGHEFHLR